MALVEATKIVERKQREKCRHLQTLFGSRGSVGKCNLDQLDVKTVEDELRVAIYLITVKDTELMNQLLETRSSHKDMKKFIRASVEADTEF